MTWPTLASELRFLELVYLMLPAYLANMAPPFVRYWRGWNRPIHAHLLGDHKTVIGFMFGVAAAVATTYVQAHYLSPKFIAWSQHLWLEIGLAVGLAAMAGDSIKSYFKRRRSIAPGARWIPFDQLDFAIGALIALSFFVPLRLGDIAVLLVFTFVADIVINHVAYYLHIRRTAW